jgi:hypothetical protein
MGGEREKPKREKRKLRELIAFPFQLDFFDDLSEHDLQNLANDISENGLREPIEILPENSTDMPANTILRGHQRKRALRLNGETETIVLVRYDLADADPATIEKYFLVDNQNRRQLDLLVKAKVALRLYEIECNKPRGGLGNLQQCDARDRVGKAIGMSGRNLQRYFRVLGTPIEVQNAFRENKISLVRAGMVASLSADDQQAIAERIRGGEDPIVVLDEYIGVPDKRHRKVGDALETFAKNLQRGHNDLNDRVEDIGCRQATKHLRVLRRARTLIKAIIAKGVSEEPLQ